MWQGPSQHPLGQEGGFQLRQSRAARTQAALRPAVEAVFLKAALASSPPRPENPALTAGSGPSPCCRVAEASGPCFSPRPLSSTPPDSTAPRGPGFAPLGTCAWKMRFPHRACLPSPVTHRACLPSPVTEAFPVILPEPTPAPFPLESFPGGMRVDTVPPSSQELPTRLDGGCYDVAGAAACPP